MGITKNKKKLKALANELAKDLKTPEDLSALTAWADDSNFGDNIKATDNLWKKLALFLYGDNIYE